MWFVVDTLGSHGAPYGPCFCTSVGEPTGESYALGSNHIEVVRDELVPDHIWVELAKFRLLK